MNSQMQKALRNLNCVAGKIGRGPLDTNVTLAGLRCHLRNQESRIQIASPTSLVLKTNHQCQNHLENLLKTLILFPRNTISGPLVWAHKIVMTRTQVWKTQSDNKGFEGRTFSL